MPKRIVYGAIRSLTTPAARYPADPRVVFILALCVISGVPLAIGHATPGSIDAKLNHVWVIIWGVMLVFGSLATLIGILKLDADGILLEQIGSVAVGGASIMYGAVILATITWQGTVPSLVFVAFGLACFWRWGQLQALIHQARRTAADLPAEDGGE